MTWRYHDACRNPLSDCRNGTVGLLEVTVGLCRTTVGLANYSLLSEFTVGLSAPGLRPSRLAEQSLGVGAQLCAPPVCSPD